MVHLINLASLESLITHYGYVLIFPISVIEGPIVTVISAFLASQGYLNIFIVYTVVVAGDILGDSIFYLIGYSAKDRILGKSSFMGLPGAAIKSLSEQFKKNDAKVILAGKLTHSLGFAVLITAGIVKMKFGKFIFYNFLGTLPKSLVLLLLGYYFGKSYRSISTYIDYASLSAFIVLSLAVGIYLYLQQKKIYHG